MHILGFTWLLVWLPQTLSGETDKIPMLAVGILFVYMGFPVASVGTTSLLSKCVSLRIQGTWYLKNKLNGSLLKDYIFTRSRSGIASTRNVQWIDLGSDLGRRHFASTSSTNGHTTRTSPTYGRKMGIYLKYVELYYFLNVGFLSRFFFL